MIMNERAMDVRSVITVVMITKHVEDSFLITFLEKFWIFCSTLTSNTNLKNLRHGNANREGRLF